MMSPCCGCHERTAVPNCHAHCERYAAFAEVRETIRERHQQDQNTIGAKIEGVYRNKKRKNWR